MYFVLQAILGVPSTQGSPLQVTKMFKIPWHKRFQIIFLTQSIKATINMKNALLLHGIIIYFVKFSSGQINFTMGNTWTAWLCLKKFHPISAKWKYSDFWKKLRYFYKNIRSKSNLILLLSRKITEVERCLRKSLVMYLLIFGN